MLALVHSVIQSVDSLVSKYLYPKPKGLAATALRAKSPFERIQIVT
jgi:hypothetical protein